MKKIEIILYNFNELNEDVQKNLIEEEIEKIIQKNFECLPDYFKVMMEEEGLEDLEISYSLSYSQGDGVSFEGVIDFEKDNIFKKVLDNSKYKQEITNILNEGFTFKLERKEHHYTHKYTCAIENDVYYWDEETKKVLIEFETQLEQVYYTLCDRYKEVGYSCYEVSEEEAIESILEKDLLYYEDGRIYKY